MLYTYPDYYKKFSCIADSCEDTCCAGWEIMIDMHSLKKYQKTEGPLGNRLANSINWKEGCFLQYDGRCAFLNEDNLCDLYLEGGKNYFCKTCRTYPRHIEEFEGVREVSLAISCPEACRIVLGRKDPVTFKNLERKTDEETYDFFDYLLYSKLCDLRTCIIRILQNRTLPIRLRISMVLALAHDADGHIRRKESFAVDDLIERYTKEGAADRFAQRLKQTLTADTTVHIRDNCHAPAGEVLKIKPQMPGNADYLAVLKKLEVLRPSWTEFLDHIREKYEEDNESGNTDADGNGFDDIICHPIVDRYKGGSCTECEDGSCSWEKGSSNDTDSAKQTSYAASESQNPSRPVSCERQLALTDIQLEQLMVYWIFTYLVGAVYDEEVFAKVQLAVYSTILVDHMIRTEPSIDPESDQAMIIEIVHNYSREIEHSDLNLEALEREFRDNPIFSLENMLCWINK